MRMARTITLVPVCGGVVLGGATMVGTGTRGGDRQRDGRDARAANRPDAERICASATSSATRSGSGGAWCFGRAGGGPGLAGTSGFQAGGAGTSARGGCGAIGRAFASAASCGRQPDVNGRARRQCPGTRGRAGSRAGAARRSPRARPAGIGIRENSTPITRDTSRCVPHLFD